MPPDMLRSVNITSGEASRRGVLYEVANGERIPNLGERIFTGVTDKEGHSRTIKAQVCEVSKPLMSVSRLVKAGNSVVFSAQGSYIEDDASGERIHLEEVNGMFNLKVWVKTGAAQAAGF